MSNDDFKKISPVVLVGGSGERLWPISRFFYPKPFVDFDKQGSMFQKTVDRIQGMGKAIIIGNEKHQKLLGRQLSEINQKNFDVILEPFPKNTAPSLTIACMKILKDYGDSLVLVLPADHVVSDLEKFQEDIDRSYKFAEDGDIVLFGIEPKVPETQFGYIKTVSYTHLTLQTIY